MSAGAKHTFELVEGYLTSAAAKMPEEHYSFRPVPEERSFAQVIGHVADANFGLCSLAAGERPPMSGIEAGKTTKADLTKALADAFQYCGRVYAAMTDAAGTAVVNFFGGGPIQRRPEAMPKISLLEYNTHHNFNNYGNLETWCSICG